MINYIISTSSTADLTEEYIASHDINIIPLCYIIDDVEYPKEDGTQHSIEEIYKMLRDGVVIKTSMINSARYEEVFRSILDSGKDLIHIELSSGISGSYANAEVVVEKLRKDYPDRKIYVIDSLCASRGLGLMVDYMLKMQEKGATIEEVYEFTENNKLKLIHWFTVDDLEFLRRGGRVGSVSAFVGGMLKIKPILNVNNEGKLIPLFKVRGRKKSIQGMVDQMKNDIVNPDGQTVFICHGDCIEDAEYAKKLILEAFPTIASVEIGYTGSVIGSHSGPGTLAIFYMGKERFEKK